MSATTATTASKVVLVTGANKGIGYNICLHLLRGGHQVLLACRDQSRGNEAVAKLQSDGGENAKNKILGVVPFDLDGSPDQFQQSVAATQSVLGEGKKLDAVVHNAGFAYTHDATEPFALQATVTNRINYFGTVSATEAFLPLMADGSRIVLVGSRAGFLQAIPGEDIKKKLTKADLTVAELSASINEFVSLAQDNKHVAAGWCNTAYGTSKIGVNVYARVMANDARLKQRGITINSCCPGWCATDMAGSEAPRSAEEGASTPAWLAVSKDAEGQSGKFYGERTELDLANGKWF